MKKVSEILPQGVDKFSPKQIAAYLREAEPSLNDTTVLRWCQSGKIEAIKPQGRWYVTRLALAKLLVAFGIASMALAHGNHTHMPYSVDTREIYHDVMKADAIAHGMTFNRS